MNIKAVLLIMLIFTGYAMANGGSLPAQCGDPGCTPGCNPGSNPGVIVGGQPFCITGGFGLSSVGTGMFGQNTYQFGKVHNVFKLKSPVRKPRFTVVGKIDSVWEQQSKQKGRDGTATQAADFRVKGRQKGIIRPGKRLRTRARDVVNFRAGTNQTLSTRSHGFGKQNVKQDIYFAESVVNTTPRGINSNVLEIQLQQKGSQSARGRTSCLSQNQHASVNIGNLTLMK